MVEMKGFKEVVLIRVGLWEIKGCDGAGHLTSGEAWSRQGREHITMNMPHAHDLTPVAHVQAEKQHDLHHHRQRPKHISSQSSVFPHSQVTSLLTAVVGFDSY